MLPRLCDLDEPKPYRKSLIRLDLGDPHHSSAEQSMYIWCRGFLRASKEKLALSPGCGCHRLAFVSAAKAVMNG